MAPKSLDLYSSETFCASRVRPGSSQTFRVEVLWEAHTLASHLNHLTNTSSTFKLECHDATLLPIAMARRKDSHSDFSTYRTSSLNMLSKRNVATSLSSHRNAYSSLYAEEGETTADDHDEPKKEALLNTPNVLKEQAASSSSSANEEGWTNVVSAGAARRARKNVVSNDRVGPTHLPSSEEHSSAPAPRSGEQERRLELDARTRHGLRVGDISPGTIVFIRGDSFDDGRKSRYYIIVARAHGHIDVVPIYTYNNFGLEGKSLAQKAFHNSVKPFGAENFANQSPSQQVLELQWVAEDPRQLRLTSVAHVLQRETISVDAPLQILARLTDTSLDVLVRRCDTFRGRESIYI